MRGRKIQSKWEMKKILKKQFGAQDGSRDRNRREIGRKCVWKRDMYKGREEESEVGI